MADTGVLDVDENLIWTGLVYGNLFVLDGTTGLLNDLCPLFLWDFWHCGCVKVGKLLLMGRKSWNW